MSWPLKQFSINIEISGVLTVSESISIEDIQNSLEQDETNILNSPTFKYTNRDFNLEAKEQS